MLTKFIAKGLHVALVACFFCALHSLAQEEGADAESRHLFRLRCRDMNPQCLNWKRLCYLQSVKSMCRKTCGICGSSVILKPVPVVCRDTNNRCRSWQQYCRGGQISDICPKTCNTCPDVIEEESGWTKWDAWSSCDAECGGGEQFRTRQCSGRPNECPGESTEEKECNIHDCPDCEDRESWCFGYRRYCRRPGVRNSCPKTCGQCNGGGGGGGGGGNNRCNPNPCENDGVCSRVGRSYRCRCKPGYSGRNCQKGSNNNPCRDEPCLNGGACQRIGTTYSCRCRPGYSGKNCGTSANPCSNNPCENGGTCWRSGTSYTCNCRPGFNGKNCELGSNPCSEEPCLNEGTCQPSGSSYTCRCRSGYSGKNCGTSEGDCTDEPWCSNYIIRQCIFNQFVRQNCRKKCQLCGGEEDPCDPNPCQYDGTCVKSGSSYRCECKTGYTGKNCETASDPCASNPCNNGGTCRRSGGGFNCVCKPGFTGKLCDTTSDPCASNPCKNDGTCRRSGGGFTCVCKPGYTGKLCDTRIGGTCVPNPCQYGGTCKITSSGAVACKCAIGYRGDKCQTKLSIGEWSTCSKLCDGGTRYRGKPCTENDVAKCPREYGDCNMQECNFASCPTYRFGSRSQCCIPSSGGCGTSVPRNVQSRILGGVTSKDAQWPWMAAVYYKPTNDFYCAATILNNRWLVSAGHCINPYKPTDLKILVGTNVRAKPDVGHKWIEIERKVVHPTFDSPVDDIALIKTRTSIVFSRDIKPLCLPNGERLEEETICFAAGWGVASVEDMKTRTPSDVLKHVGLRTLPLDACVQGYRGLSYARGVNNKIICSGLLGGGKDACLGDSGGPLVCQRKNSCEWYNAGINSFGASECAVGHIPAGFMDVAHYETWIKGYINT